MPFTPVDNYPDGAALKQFLLGLSVPAITATLGSLDTDGAAAAAADDWERQTRWLPFLSSGLSETRSFDPPVDSPILFLSAGLLSLTRITVNVVGGSAGVPLVAGRDFRLLPQNAPAQSKPSEIVEFLSGGYPAGAWQAGFAGIGYGFSPLAGAYGQAGSVQITGEWGRVLAVPADAQQAVLRMGALLLAPEMAAAISKGLVERKAGDETERFAAGSVSALSTQMAAWEGVRERALARWTRPSY